MRTDISLTSDSRKIIIDCKFTPKATQAHFEAKTLRSSHLYQVCTYLNNLPDGALTDSCEVMLFTRPWTRPYPQFTSMLVAGRSASAPSTSTSIGSLSTMTCWRWLREYGDRTRHPEMF